MSNKLVALQTYCIYREAWETYGLYRAGSKPLRAAQRNQYEHYHYTQVRVIPHAQFKAEGSR